MKLRGIIALAVALACSPVLAQTNPGTSPLTGSKGGTNNAFMQFTGPTTSLKTFTLPDASDTIATLAAVQTLTNKTLTTPVINGTPSGTGVNLASAASTLALRDPSGLLYAINHVDGFTSTATAAGTTTLTVASSGTQIFTGSTTQTVVLPVTATLNQGHSFWIVNNSTGAVTVNSSGGNSVVVLAANTSARVDCVLTSGITAASWTFRYFSSLGFGGKSLTHSATLTLAGTDSTTITFQGTDTYVGRATTDTLTNKTFDTAGTGNSFSINGVAASANTGTGAVVRATSPTLITPTLGAATATTINGVTIDNNAWTSYTPTVSASSGTFTTVSATGRYKQIGKTIHMQADVTITSKGTAATNLQVSLPLTAASNVYIGIAREHVLNGRSGAAIIQSGGSIAIAIDAAATTFIADGAVVAYGITYEIP